MATERLKSLVGRYRDLRIALVGDFCLDRYFEIDPARREVSLETGLEVHNVTRVRCQPGAAGTVLNNLAALGVGEILPVGFRGDDGEGWELERALRAVPGVELASFFVTPERRTFTYSKPLVMHPGGPPVELNRLDVKNWTPTPSTVEDRLRGAVFELARTVDAMIVLDQVDVEGTGAVTRSVLGALEEVSRRRLDLLIVADSRRGLAGFPPVIYKMNAAELAKLTGEATDDLAAVRAAAERLARRNGRPVFVTLAQKGIVGASPDGASEHAPSLPLRGPIDIVGAGDSVTANLTAALAAGASLLEAMMLAQAAASIVVHQLGTTGTATPEAILSLL